MKTRWKFVAATCMSLMFVAGCGGGDEGAQAPANGADGQADAATDSASSSGTPGVAVGETAPEFTLLNQEGVNVSLSDLLSQGKVALVFYRSADW